jgi:hypothetical protein
MEVSTTGVNFTNQLQQGGVAVPTASQVAAKQDTLVSGTNIKTINSTSILGSGNINVVTSPSGVSGAIQFSDGSAFASDAANFFWNNTTKRLGVGTNAPISPVTIQNTSAQILAWSRVAGVSGSLDITNVRTTGGQGTVLNVDSFSFRNSSLENYLVSEANRLGIGTNNDALTARATIKGSGSTSATTSLLVQNSGGTELLKVADNGEITTFDINARVIYARANTLELRPNASGGASSASLQGFVSGLGWLSMFTAESGKDFGQIPRGAVVNGTTIDASAIFQVDSTTKGFLPPRMTTTQKNAITAVAGLVVYDSTTNKLQCYNGSTWNDLF